MGVLRLFTPSVAPNQAKKRNLDTAIAPKIGYSVGQCPAETLVKQ